MKSFSGIIPPIVTAFSADGKKIDVDNSRRIIKYVISNGCSGIFVAGSQGEFFSMTDQERIEAMEIAVDESKGNFPVFGGTGAISTDRAVEMTKTAEKVGCNAVSVINPFFISLNDEELYQYYATIAKSTHLPILIYNNPDRTHAQVPISVIARLAEIDNIVGMKDSSGDLTYVNAVLHSVKKPFNVFCGKDTVIYNELLSGASGAVAASANVAPKLVSEIYNKVKSNDLQGALKAQYELTPLRNAFSLGSFPVVVKEALSILGINVGPCRKPIMPMIDENRKKLQKVLETIGLLK